MPIAETLLSQPRPADLQHTPRAAEADHYHPSPSDWRDEVLYFLLPDRFSDGRETSRPLLDRSNLGSARPVPPDAPTWLWNRWAESGEKRWQGGTILGITSKLDYLKQLGVTAIWVGARVVVDASLNRAESSLTVVLNTAEAAQRGPPSFHPVGSKVPVRRAADGTAFVEVGNIPASEVLILMSHPGVGSEQ